MRIYIDDDTAAAVLVAVLRKAGHDVLTPVDAATSGTTDPRHFIRAIREQRACLTRNYGDFEELHLLIQEARGHHPGILVVRQDNDPTRDLTPRGVVRAIRNLEKSGTPIVDQYIVLNHWR